MKNSCIRCEKTSGKRTCKLHNNDMVCPPCCAVIRNQDCEGCNHYTVSQHYQASKAQCNKEKPFIIAFDEEVEQQVDKALELLENHSIQESKHIIQALLRTHPQNHMVHYAMGLCYAFENDNDNALVYFNHAIEIFPYFTEAHFNKGVVHQKKLDIRQMIESFQRVIEFGDPDEGYVQQAKQIIHDFEHQLEQDDLTLPAYFKAMDHFEQGFAAMQVQNWTGAIQEFKRGLAINSKHPQSYGNIGICYGQLGKKALALEALEHALDLDPTYEPALVNRVVIESLQEGEALTAGRVANVDYYKEYPMQKKSYIQSVVEKFKNIRK